MKKFSIVLSVYWNTPSIRRLDKKIASISNDWEKISNTSFSLVTDKYTKDELKSIIASCLITDNDTIRPEDTFMLYGVVRSWKNGRQTFPYTDDKN